MYHNQFREGTELRARAQLAQRTQNELKRLVKEVEERPQHLADTMWKEVQPHIQEKLREIRSEEVNNIVQGMRYQEIRQQREIWEIEAGMVVDPTQEVRDPPDMTKFRKYYSYPVLHVFGSMTPTQQQDVEGDLQRRTVSLARQSRARDYVEFLRVHEQQVHERERRQKIIEEGTRHISWTARLEPME
jgi:hypothetical protein